MLPCGNYRCVNAAMHRSWSADLDLDTLYALLALRVEVFVVEQKCPYPELDGADLLPGTRHFWLEREGVVLGTARLLELDGARDFRIGRLCVAMRARGRSYARRLMEAALADVGTAQCRLSAQSHLVGMYAAHGFVPAGPEYVEDGIPHVPMLRTARATTPWPHTIDTTSLPQRTAIRSARD